MIERWETVDQINAARERLERDLGWNRPAAWGLVTRDGDVLRSNVETGYLPAVALATVLGYSGGSAELPLGPSEIDRAIAIGAPAEACTDIPHPNMTALRLLAGGEAVAVFVGAADLTADFGTGQPHLRALMAEIRRGREENADETTTLYRPVGPKELALLRDSGFTAWPPRLADQPIFYPVLNEDYAAEIAAKWNVEASGSGYVTRFRVRTDFARRYPTQQAGGADKLELWIPAADVDAVNHNLAGPIEVLAGFGRD